MRSLCFFTRVCVCVGSIIQTMCGAISASGQISPRASGDTHTSQACLCQPSVSTLYPDSHVT